MAHAMTVQESHYYAKAPVLASYKIGKQYPVYVMLHSKTGDVLDAKCQCKESAMGRCSHAAALLYALLDFVMIIKSSNARTSKLCEWNRGCQKKLPLRAEENQYKQKTIHAKTKALDPSPVSSNTKSHIYNVNSFISNLQQESSARSSVSM